MDDDEPGTGLTIWLCPICNIGQFYEDRFRHVRDEHPGHVLKEIHPTAEGHA